jgi:hypothetical protein
MVLGQLVRSWIKTETFRLCFFIGLSAARYTSGAAWIVVID